MPEVARQDHASTEQLSALLDSRAEQAELPFLTSHIVECTRCAHELDGLRSVRDLLRSLPVQLPPRSFTIPVTLPTRRFRRLVPLTRVLSAVAAILCVVLLSVDAMTGTYEAATPSPKLTSALLPEPASKAAESAPNAVRALATATGGPAVAAAPPAPASAPQRAAAAPQPAPRSADAVAAGAPAPPATQVPPAPLATAPVQTAVTTASAPSSEANSQSVSPAGPAALRIAAILLGAIAIGMFIASVLLRRVAVASPDVRLDGLDQSFDR